MNCNNNNNNNIPCCCNRGSCNKCGCKKCCCICPPGPRGPAGLPGQAGVTGATGPSGGPTGATGATGTNGTDGATGATGLNGTDGTDGATGTTGATGTNGTDGTDGATGATGTNGTDGATGATGATGTNGTDGATGATGATGPTGPTGPAAVVNRMAGANGATGAIGPKGDPGYPMSMLAFSSGKNKMTLPISSNSNEGYALGIGSSIKVNIVDNKINANAQLISGFTFPIAKNCIIDALVASFHCPHSILASKKSDLVISIYHCNTMFGNMFTYLGSTNVTMMPTLSNNLPTNSVFSGLKESIDQSIKSKSRIMVVVQVKSQTETPSNIDIYGGVTLVLK